MKPIDVLKAFLELMTCNKLNSGNIKVYVWHYNMDNVLPEYKLAIDAMAAMSED